MCPRPRRFAIDRASMRDPGVGWRRATWLVLCGLAVLRVVVAQGDCDRQNMGMDAGECKCTADKFPVVYERELLAENEYGVKDTKTVRALNDLDYTYGGTNRLAFGRNDVESLFVLGGLWVGINAFRFNITAETGQVYAAQNHNNTDVCINTDMNKERLSARHAISVSDDGNIAFVAGKDNGDANVFRVQHGVYYKLNPSGDCGGSGTILMKALPTPSTQQEKAAACAAACMSRDTPDDSTTNGWEGKESWEIESFSISTYSDNGHCECLHAPVSGCPVAAVDVVRYDFTDYDQCDTSCREIRIHNPVVSVFFTDYHWPYASQQKYVVDVMVSGSNLQVLWRSAIYTGIDIINFRRVFLSQDKLHQENFITNPDIPGAMSSTPSIPNVTYVAVNHKLYTADTTDPASFAFTHVSAVTVNISDLAFSHDGALLYTLEADTGDIGVYHPATGTYYPSNYTGIYTPTHAAAGLASLAASPDGQFLAAMDGETLSVVSTGYQPPFMANVTDCEDCPVDAVFTHGDGRVEVGSELGVAEACTCGVDLRLEEDAEEGRGECVVCVRTM